MLLVLTMRGKRYRFASSDQVITSAEIEGPNPLVFAGGLAPIEIEDLISLGDTNSDARTVELELLFQRDTLAGWAALADASHDLGDARGELSIWREGDDFSARQRLLVGFLDSPAYGAVGQPVQITLSEDTANDRALIPPTGSQVDEGTYPEAGGLQVGDGISEQWYPWVFGEPGRVFGTPAVPALLTEISTADGDNSVTSATVVLAGHDAACAGASTTLHNYTDGTSATVTPSRAKDGLGRTVTEDSVARTAAGGLDIDDGDQLWWGVNTVGRGGVYDGHINSSSLRGAGDILGFLLERSTVPVDLQRLRFAIPALNAYKLDFWVNSQTSPLDIIETDILPYLPVTIGRSAIGIYPVLWRWNAQAHQAVATINPTTRGGQRQGLVATSSVSEIFNEIRIDFARCGPTGDYQGHIVLAPRDLNSDPNVEAHPVAFASWTMYHGPAREHLAAPGIQCGVTDDRSTARAIAEWQLWRGAQTRRTVSYLLPQKYQALAPGDIVVVTDNEISWTEKVCLVTSVIRAPGDTLLTLETVSNWIRDAPG